MSFFNLRPPIPHGNPLSRQGLEMSAKRKVEMTGKKQSIIPVDHQDECRSHWSFILSTVSKGADKAIAARPACEKRCQKVRGDSPC